MRPAKLTDIEPILALGWSAFERISPLPLSRERLETTLCWLVGDPAGYLQIAEGGGEIIGFIGGVAAPFAPWSDEFCATELFLFVAPGPRGGGAAMGLLRGFLEWACSRQCRIVSASSQSGLDGARVGKLYQRLGFVEQETNFIYRMT
jgi:GNAT superfamily N-acetyltransferase